jgi:hypothetical protein
MSVGWDPMNSHRLGSAIMTSVVLMPPLFAAAGYSLVYLLGGGGLVGAIVIFILAKALGK